MIGRRVSVAVVGLVLLVCLDRNAARNANFVLIASDRIAVPAARSAARDAGNQPRGAVGISRGGAPWLVAGHAQQTAPQAQQLQQQQDQLNRQPGAVYDADFVGQPSGPAPRRSLAGIWEFAAGRNVAIQANGAMAMPSDGKPEHELPFTPEGRAAFMANKPTFGVTQVPSALTNDPMPGCDPQGFPRILLHNAHTEQILETSTQVVILYQFNKKWRSIWTDGRALPKDPENPNWDIKDVSLKELPPTEPRWWGYSVGRWVDDFTFVAESNGFDDRTWLDNAGRPHSTAMRVIETYHRVDADHIQKTLVIDDPKYYSRPWTAFERLRMRLQSPHLEIPEQECVPSETAKYNKLFGDLVGGVDDPAK